MPNRKNLLGRLRLYWLAKQFMDFDTMKIFGMVVKHPTTRELALAAVLISLIAGFGFALQRLGLINSQLVWPGVAAFATGVILTAFGFSINSYGLRAWLFLTAVGLLLFFLLPTG